MIRSLFFTSIFFALFLFVPFVISSAPTIPGDGVFIAAVDRIEEEKAVIVLDDGSCIVLPLSVLDSDLKEGDCINMAFAMDAPRKEVMERDVSLGLGGLLGEAR